MIIHSNKRLPYVDALRGFAALYVVTYHICRLGNLTVPSWLTPVISLGGSSVTLFFIISAFTLCLTLEGKTHESNWVLKFYIRRAARILPLYYAWLLVMLLIKFGYNVFHYYTLSLAFFLYNFQPGRQEGLVWASWTLGVEMVFYLFFPLFFRFARNLKRSVLLFSCSLVISTVHYYLTRNINNYDINFSLLYQFPVFCLGMITYQVYKNFNLNRIGLILILSAITLFSFVALKGSAFSTYLLALVYSFLLLGLSVIPFIANKVTVFLGKISYSLYLNHPMLVGFLVPYYATIYLGKSTLPKFLICVVITIIPLVTISYLTYRLIERPGGRLVKRIGQVFISKFHPVIKEMRIDAL